MSDIELKCTCHCGGTMFYRHLHAPHCAVSVHGKEAPKEKQTVELEMLRAQREQDRQRIQELEFELGATADQREKLNDACVEYEQERCPCCSKQLQEHKHLKDIPDMFQQLSTLTHALAQARGALETIARSATSRAACSLRAYRMMFQEIHRTATTALAALAVPAAGGGGYDDMFPVSFMKTEHGYQLLDRHNDLLATFEMSRDDHECQKVVDAINAAAPAPTPGGGKG